MHVGKDFDTDRAHILCLVLQYGWMEISCSNPVTSGSLRQPLLLLVPLSGRATAGSDGWCFNPASDSGSLVIFLPAWVALGCTKPCVCF